MPTYEYACKSCGEHAEVVQSFTDVPLDACPSCGARTLRKVFGNVGIVLKGSGFYRTDNRTNGSKAPGGGAAKDGSGAADGSSSSSDGSAKAGADPASGSTTKPVGKGPAGKGPAGKGSGDKGSSPVNGASSSPVAAKT